MHKFFSASEKVTSPSETKINVTHLMQEHAGQDFCAFIARTPEIAYSQFRIIEEILANPDAIIVLEGLEKDLTPEVRNRLDLFLLIKQAKEFFPDTVPDKFEDLTGPQMDFLATHGGAKTLYYLGIRDYVYKSATSSFYEKHGKKDFYEREDEDEDKLHNIDYYITEREKKAIRCLQKMALTLGEKEVSVLLIFGIAHNFEARIKAMKNENLIFKTKINTTHSVFFLGNSFKDRCEYFLHRGINNFFASKELSKGEGKEYIGTTTLYDGVIFFDFHSKTNTVSDYTVYTYCTRKK
jgi:hypothetical protein